MPLIVYEHESARDHVTPPGHPEQVARMDSVDAAIAATGDHDRRPAPEATDAQLTRAHPQAYVDAIRGAAPESGWVSLDADTHMSPGSLQAALCAAGANCAAVDAVLGAEANAAFAAMRPPGHHAEKARPMGFCLFASAAIGALHAMEAHGLSRIAICDFDVHHGNGTQDVLWDQDRAVFASSHQMPLFPGTGAADETGAHANICNAPLSPGDDGRAFRDVMQNVMLPAIDAHKPELIIISAGFDAHEADPLANLNLHEEDFAWATRMLCDLATIHCKGRIVSTLEGGYDLPALERSLTAHLSVLKEHAA